jgi:hypothetical protein
MFISSIDSSHVVLLAEHSYADFLSETDFSTQLGDGIQCAFGTLPPCRFTISKRGQRDLTGEFRALR